LHRDAVPDGGKHLVQARRAFDDQQLRSLQTAFDQAIENRGRRRPRSAANGQAIGVIVNYTHPAEGFFKALNETV
jgi:hypothetical protein